MSFTDEVRVFALKVEVKSKDVITEAGVEVQRSLVEGSEITGAPGQPVDTGALRASFVPERLGDYEWQITTNLVYAPSVEDGVQAPYVTARGTTVTPLPMRFRSAVGGAHSLALTRASWESIVEVATDRTADRG
jgi:hypothetical protein